MKDKGTAWNYATGLRHLLPKNFDWKDAGVDVQGKKVLKDQCRLSAFYNKAKDLTIANFLECRGRSNYEVYSWINKNSLGNRFLELAGCIASYQEGTMLASFSQERCCAVFPAGLLLLRNGI